MTRDEVLALCAAYPGASLSYPWREVGKGDGPGAWKVSGKMFACLDGKGAGLCVKTPDIETAQMLIEVGIAVKAPYFHRSWVLLPFETDADEIEFRLGKSYALIRRKLTKKAQAALPAYPACVISP